jgi:hypothetical protein
MRAVEKRLEIEYRKQEIRLPGYQVVEIKKPGYQGML